MKQLQVLILNYTLKQSGYKKGSSLYNHYGKVIDDLNKLPIQQSSNLCNRGAHQDRLDLARRCNNSLETCGCKCHE